MAVEELFLKLFKFSNDISQRIARGFVSTTVLNHYNNSFSKFLEDEKHIIYHLWINKFPCCLCTCRTNPVTFPATRILHEEQLEKMFTVTKDAQCVYSLRRDRCLCRIKVKGGCTLDELDLTIIFSLVKNCVTNISKDDVDRIESITKIRNKICHAPSLEAFNIVDLERSWGRLESYVLDLASNCELKYTYKGIKEEIRALKNSPLTIQEGTELVNAIREENEQLANALLRWIDDTRLRLEEKTNEIKQNSKILDKSLGDYRKMLVEINNLNFDVDMQVISTQTDESTFDARAKDDWINRIWIGGALFILVCGIPMGLINHNLSNQIGAFTVGVGACLLILLIIPWKAQNVVRLLKATSDLYLCFVPQKIASDKICEVRWFFTTPSQWDPEDMKKKLEDMAAQLNLPFKIRFIYVGSLVIHTTMEKSVLNDKGVLNTAIESFLRKMVEICEIDTSIKQTVQVELLFTETSSSEESTDTVFKANTVNDRVVCPNCSYSFKPQDARAYGIIETKEDEKIEIETTDSGIEEDFEELTEKKFSEKKALSEAAAWSEEQVAQSGAQVALIFSEEENFYKIYMLVMLGIHALRIWLTDRVPKDKLDNLLSGFKEDKTTWMQFRGRIREKLKEHLSVDQMDFHLLYQLIKFIVRESPDTIDTNSEEISYIERLRDYRNIIAHSHSSQMSQHDFKSSWTELSQIALVLSKGSLEKEVDILYLNRIVK